MIEVTKGVKIPEGEITFTASHVNKVSSRVTLEWDMQRSSAVSENQRRRITSKLATRINKEGILRVVSQRTRSQELNRADALDRFVTLLQGALHEERPRLKTQVAPAARAERIAVKKRRTVTKQLRAKRNWDIE
jgi:ribosome-associated protein